MKRIIVLAVLLFALVSGQTVYAKSGNFRFSPLGIFIGWVNVDLDFPVSSNWTIGPTFSYWSFKVSYNYYDEDITTTVYAAGLRGNWYKNGVYETGMYVSPMLRYASATASVRDVSATASGMIVSGIVGYHWFWDSFNLSLGGGYGVMVGESKVKVNDGGNTTEVNVSRSGGLEIDFMLGFTF